MKTLILLAILAYLQVNNAFMNLKEFDESNLERCYDTNLQDSRRSYQKNINGQALPLPSSMETLVSLIERYESLNPGETAQILTGKLLKSFRMDDLKNPEEPSLRDEMAKTLNEKKRRIFSIDQVRYEFKDEDFTDDEKCALHFMLSHTVNETKVHDGDEVIEGDVENRAKRPRENGIVSLYSDPVHAIAVGRVLLGIYAAFQLPPKQSVQALLKTSDISFQNVEINPVYAVTIGDLITRLAPGNAQIQENGEWTDISCPTEYKLKDNNKGYITYSELRGAIDGLIIGKKIQEDKSSRQDFANFRLSQILRQYYGFTGLVDPSRTKWCEREGNFLGVTDKENEMYNFYGFYTEIRKSSSDVIRNKITQALSQIGSDIYRDINKECSTSQTSLDRKFVSPRNIFAILDYSPPGSTKLNFQAEVIGNFSSDFDFRPRGNLMGVFSNIKPLQQNTLDVIVKNNGTAGCPSCFAKYYYKTGNKEDDAELFRDLNDTLTTFDEEQEQLEERYQSEVKAGSPGKIVLYFNFGNPSTEHKVQDALWDIRRHFRGLTILAIGDKRESLTNYVENDQTDIFSQSSSAKTISDLKQRINQVPAEYTYRDCNSSSPAREADNKQVAFITPNKIQYWAMYPQFFLKSHHITMKFTPQEGSGIRVCFARWYGSILEGKNENCKDSTGGEIEFRVSNPCYKRNVFNCDPFYFSVEGKKQPTTYCQSLRCSTPYDIQFEFSHEGISCNVASYVSVSFLAILFAAIMYYAQKQ